MSSSRSHEPFRGATPSGPVGPVGPVGRLPGDDGRPNGGWDVGERSDLTTRQTETQKASYWQRRGFIMGLGTTLGIHLLLLGFVLFADGRDDNAPRAATTPRETVIRTRLVSIQAGSAAGRRRQGPAFKRRAGARRPRRAPGKRRSVGRRPRTGMRPTPSGRPSWGGVKRRPAADQHSQATDDMARDDAVQLPPGFESARGVMAPPGARSADDRHGSGGEAAMGILDPCRSQHGSAVASYKSRLKVPRMRRPAFVSAAVAANLITTVRAWLDASGRISRVAVASSSGNTRFDAAAVTHVNGAARFPAPHKCVLYDPGSGRFRSRISVAIRVRVH